MFRRILAKFDVLEIGRDPADVYMRRFKLLKTRWFHVYLHEILRSDEPCLHDHPWRFITLILAGGYTEHLRDGHSRWRPPGTFLYRPAKFARRVETRGAWSLVVVGQRVRPWGFFTSRGWRQFIYGQASPLCE